MQSLGIPITGNIGFYGKVYPSEVKTLSVDGWWGVRDTMPEDVRETPYDQRLTWGDIFSIYGGDKWYGYDVDEYGDIDWSTRHQIGDLIIFQINSKASNALYSFKAMGDAGSHTSDFLDMCTAQGPFQIIIGLEWQYDPQTGERTDDVEHYFIRSFNHYIDWHYFDDNDTLIVTPPAKNVHTYNGQTQGNDDTIFPVVTGYVTEIDPTTDFDNVKTVFH